MKFVGLHCIVQTQLPKFDEEGSICLELVAIKDTRERQLQHQTIKEFLVQWKDTQPKDATWELVSLLQQFLHLHP
jgi:hypothetical protein